MGMTPDDGTSQGMGSLFAITVKPATIRFTAGDSAAVAFTVSFTAPAPVAAPFSAHANLVPLNPAIASWLSLDGPPGRRFTPNRTEVYTVRVAAPANAPPDRYAFRLDMVGDANPDEQYTCGPSVALEIVPAAVPKAKPPIWLWVAIAAAVLIIGGTGLTFARTHRGQTATPTPALLPTPIANPIPTSTPIPTATAVQIPTSTPTPVPTPTPVATATPSPTPDTTPVAMSGIGFAPVDKNNVRITFMINKAGSARVRYATSADLANGTTVNAMNTGGNTFQVTLGVNRETQYYYQITATDRSGNSATTLVIPFRLNRTLTVTLVRVFDPFVFLLCPWTRTYTEALDYATGPSAQKTYTTSIRYPAQSGTPDDHLLNHSETIDEDPARQIVLTVDVSRSHETCGFGGAQANLTGVTYTLKAMLGPTNDWGIGLPPQTAMLDEVRMTYTVTETLTVI